MICYLSCDKVNQTEERFNLDHDRILSMKNIEMTLDGNILIMKVDLSKEFGPSKSGKSITIASTEGNISVPDRDEIKIGLNIYKSNK